MRFLVVIAACLGITACDRLVEDNRVAFDGIYFSSKVSFDKAQQENFEIVVRRATQSVDGAREAGRYEATIYCVRNFGTSDVDWVLGPDADQIQITDGDLYLKGTCRP